MKHYGNIRNWLDELIKSIPLVIENQKKAIHYIKSHKLDVIDSVEKANEFARNTKYWQEYILKWKDNKKQMALSGWFPNWTNYNKNLNIVEISEIDSYMEKNLNDNWNEITAFILECYPKRKHILEDAFKLHHEDENYIASIPLFLSQTDGIIKDELNIYYYYREGKKITEEVENIINEGINAGNNEYYNIDDVLLEILTKDLKYKSSPNAIKDRAEILHGNISKIDYGNKINSFKTISFLAFIVYLFKYIPKNT